MRVEDFYELLVFSSVKSNKFWGISGAPYTGPHSKYTTIVEYGRIGHTSRYHHYDSFGQAQDAMHAKLRKGYTGVTDQVRHGLIKIAHDEICCEDSDTIMARDYHSRRDMLYGTSFHLCLGCGSRIDHSDDSANFSRFINQSLHRRSYGTKGGSDA